MKQSIYTIDCATDLIQKYIDGGYPVYTLDEGCLGYGLVVCDGLDDWKTSVISEVYLNEWSSAQKIRMYRTMPEKYRKMIEKQENEIEAYEKEKAVRMGYEY